MKNKKQIKKLKLEVKNLRNDFCKSYEQQNTSFKKDIITLESDCAKKIYELTLKVNDVFDCLNKNDFELVNKDKIFTNNNQKKHDSHRDIHVKGIWKKSLIENSVPITPKNSPMDQLIEMVAEGFKEGYLPSAIRVNKKGKIEYLKATIDRLEKEIVSLKANQLPKELDVENICKQTVEELNRLSRFLFQRNSVEFQYLTGWLKDRIFDIANFYEKNIDLETLQKSNKEIKKDILDSALNIPND